MNAGAATDDGQAHAATSIQAQAPERGSSSAHAASASAAAMGAAQAAAGSAPHAHAQQGPMVAAFGVPPGISGAAAGQPGALSGPPPGCQMLTPGDQALLAQIRMTTGLKAAREAAATPKAAPMATAAIATDQTQISNVRQQPSAGTTMQPMMSGPNTSSPALIAATVSAAQQPQPGKAVASLPFQNRLVGPRPPQQQVSAATVSTQPEFLLQNKRGRPRSGNSTKGRTAQPGSSAPPACAAARLAEVNAAAANQLWPQGMQLAPGTYPGPQYRPAAPQQQLQPQQQLRPLSSGQVPPQAAPQAALPPMSQEQLHGVLAKALAEAQAQAQAQSQRVAPAGAQAPPAGWCPWQLTMQQAQPGMTSPLGGAPAPAAMQVTPQTQSAQGLQQAHSAALRPVLVRPPGHPCNANLMSRPSGQAVRPPHYIPWSPSAGGNNAAVQPALQFGSAGPAAPIVGPSPATAQRQPPQSPFTQAHPAAGSSGQVSGQKRAAQAPAAEQPGPAKRPHTEQPHTAAAQASAAQQAGPTTRPHTEQPHKAGAQALAAQQSGPAKRPHTEQSHTAAAQALAVQQPGPAKRSHAEQPHTAAAQARAAPPQYLTHPQAQPNAAPRGGLGPAATSQPAPLPLPAAAPPVLALPLPHAVWDGSAAAGLRASVNVRLCPRPHNAALSWLHPCSKPICRPMQCSVLNRDMLLHLSRPCGEGPCLCRPPSITWRMCCQPQWQRRKGPPS